MKSQEQNGNPLAAAENAHTFSIGHFLYTQSLANKR